ncbi:MAG: hypothetical protein Q7R39_03830 [Dehalococcoidia bacterium]|nr:hypothetical protein [Dehalococcoidia bacterium]
MNWGDDSATTCQRERDKPAAGPDPLRRKVMSALASMVDKHRRVLEEHDQVVITIHLDWRNGKLRETVMGLPASRHNVSSE